MPLAAARAQGSGRRLVLPVPRGWELARGASLAVCGVCLTVVEPAPLPGGAGTGLAFDLSAETLARTWLGEAEPGDPLNLERSLRLGDRLDGHLVQGHVDAVGRLVELRPGGDGGALVGFEVPAGFERWLVDKGSVTVDGISLTVVEPRGRRFDVAVIPETLARTNLGVARPGRPVNLEADVVGKWVERLTARGGPGA